MKQQAGVNSKVESLEKPAHGKEWKTPLQQHVAFFDRNGDGVITPMETYEGFRTIGYGFIFSVLGVILVHGLMSYPTQESWIPNPTFPIYIKNIHKGKHGSDSEIYTHDGNICIEKYEMLFGSRAENKSKNIISSFEEYWNVTNSFRDLFDPFGWAVTKLNWLFLWVLTDYSIDREAVLTTLDGSYFVKMEEKNKRQTEGAKK